MSAVNEFVMLMTNPWHLSVWIGILDPYEGVLRYCSAGHPPPLVVEDGQVSGLERRGPLLGVAAHVRYAEQTRVLGPGARLVLYTDGLTEATRNIVEGEQRLSDAVLAVGSLPAHRAVRVVADRILGEDEPRDDAALMIINTQSAQMPLSLSLPAVPDSLWRARRAVAAFGRRSGLPAAVVDAMVVAVGEATLNVVEHAYRGKRDRMVVRAELEDGDAVVIRVRDFGRWRPPVDRGRGRGTRIMQGFADTITTTTGPTGTTVELRWAARAS
jgi:anti-sigma regulatory factor (Ser/Thr protein kinase)